MSTPPPTAEQIALMEREIARHAQYAPISAYAHELQTALQAVLAYARLGVETARELSDRDWPAEKRDSVACCFGRILGAARRLGLLAPAQDEGGCGGAGEPNGAVRQRHREQRGHELDPVRGDDPIRPCIPEGRGGGGGGAVSKAKKIDGVRIKYRTFEKDEARWVSATLWIDDEPRAELAALRVDDLDPGSPLYHAWVDATSAVFNAKLSALTGLDGFVSRRERPRYKGER